VGVADGYTASAEDLANALAFALRLRCASMGAEWLEDYLNRLDEGNVEDGATGSGAHEESGRKIPAFRESANPARTCYMLPLNFGV
jgi:LDH2 family malate/lactate/ureidoglycolate dehydrogenase